MNSILRRFSRLLLLLPAALVLFFFWPAVHFGFVWDDKLILFTFPELRDPAMLWHAVAAPVMNGEYFRPVSLLTLSLEQILANGSAWLSHLDALLLHALNSSLVAVLAVLFSARHLQAPGRSLAAGMVAGSFYALHPAMIEAVAWISARFDLLVTTFCLMALLSDRLMVRPGLRALTIGGLFGLAAMSKEMALGFALLLPFWHLLFQPAGKGFREIFRQLRQRGHHLTYLAVFCMGVLYLFARVVATGVLAQPESAPLFPDVVEHVLLALKTLGGFFSMAAWPFTQISPMHPMPFSLTASDPEIVLGAAIALLFLALILRTLSAASGGGLLLVCFVLALTPVLNLIVLHNGNNYFQERYLALPLVFPALAAGLIAVKSWDWRPQTKTPRFACVAVMMFWFAFSILNIKVSLPSWKDDLSLWSWAYMRAPAADLARSNLLSAYIDSDRYKQALDFAEKCKKEQHGQLNASQALDYALLLQIFGRREEALPWLQVALENTPPADRTFKSVVYFHMATFALDRGDVPDAINNLNAALGLRPTYPDASYLLGIALVASGRETEGRARIQQGLTQMHPSLAGQFTGRVDSMVNQVRTQAKTHEKK